MKCEFSVIISVYKNDKASYLKKALESIWHLQTLRPSQIVLVLDGTVDAQLEQVVQWFSEECPVLKVIPLVENVGLGNAMHIAMENAEYDIVARMDSDDISVPNRFEEQIQFFAENTNVDVAGGDISEFVGDEENVVAYRRVPKTDGEIKAYLKKRCPLNHVSVMFKRSAVMNAGGYKTLFWNEDYYLWIRMAQQGAVMANTGTVLVNVRTGKDMYSRRGGRRYFQSEMFLQKYMLKHKMISFPIFLENALKRLIVQILLPNCLRGWVFRTFARKET